MYGWIKGKIPRENNVNYLLRLEAFFSLERHSLVQLSGIRLIGQRQEGVGKTPASIVFHTILGCPMHQIYGEKPAPGSLLRRQWTEFMRYKTAAALPAGLQRT